MTIKPDADERTQQQFSRARLEATVSALWQEGYVILHDVVRPAHLDRLREKMDIDTQTLLAAPRRNGVGKDSRRLLQNPPPFTPYVFNDIVANAFVLQVTRHVLGSGLFCDLYSSNTNLPGSRAQTVHQDAGPLWPGLKHAHPAASLVVNVPLADVNEDNGSIELWPGSHLDTSVSLWVNTRKIETRRAIAPPIRGNTKKGDVLLRDMRLWHRGMPNASDRPRHMIAMNHHIFWLGRGPALRFATGCEAAFASEDLAWHAVFTDAPIDYLRP